MNIQKKPYLVIPFLIEQPTWGGTYICEKKGWLHKTGIEGKKIGQSYELYDRSLLATSITSSADPLFGLDVKDSVPITHFAEDRPFPLIKFTQAKGNSFQLHIKPNITDSRWKQKAESWYYFEDGKVTFGIKKEIDINKYKETCISINNMMKGLSKKLIKKEISREQAQNEAKKFIKEKNPWQFVNVNEVKKGDIVDLSGGGLHHSWEEDVVNHPLGNILYEVQQDVMDPICTIRSFDQGKFKEDGTIREIHIEDYFKYLDRDKERNKLKTQQSNAVLFNTPYYILKKIEVEKRTEMMAEKSFHHLFIKEGTVSVKSDEGEVFVSCGHSCFIPKGVVYTINTSVRAELLLTSI